MSSNLPAQWTLEHVERLITKMVNKAQRLYQLDRDDLLSAAYYAFMQAHASYKHELGFKYSTWLVHKVNGRFKDLLRNRSKNKLFQVEEFDATAPDDQKFDAEGWLSQLTEPARHVAKLVLDMPMDVKATIAHLGGMTPVNCRQAVREFLRDQGWTEEETIRAFQEVRRNL